MLARHSFRKKVHFVKQVVPNIRVTDILLPHLFLLQTSLHFSRHCVTSKVGPVAVKEQPTVVLRNYHMIVTATNFEPVLMLRLIVKL